jgi:hypothetical protein
MCGNYSEELRAKHRSTLCRQNKSGLFAGIEEKGKRPIFAAHRDRKSSEQVEFWSSHLISFITHFKDHRLNGARLVLCKEHRMWPPQCFPNEHPC